jgi:pimeloyl-ACP methyl ester carboxylesterase
MLHEGLGSLALWKDFPVQLALATGCRVLVYSRLGYGGSTVLTEPRKPDYMHAEARVWLPQILAMLDVRRPFLFGHSDGASIALIHAARPESDVAGLMLLAPHVIVEDLTVSSIAQARVAYETTALPQRLAPYHRDGDATFWGWNRIWLDPAFRDWDIRALLPAIRCPVLAIQGREDEYGTLRQLELLQSLVADTQILVLPDCRHSPHRDQTAAVLAAAGRFVHASSR